MALKDLTEEERQLVLQCVRAAADGPFFDEEEFHTLFGLYRADVLKVATNWAVVDDSDEHGNVALAINNAMNNLTGYPHEKEYEWSRFISVSRAEVIRIFHKWRGRKNV